MFELLCFLNDARKSVKGIDASDSVFVLIGVLRGSERLSKCFTDKSTSALVFPYQSRTLHLLSVFCVRRFLRH